LQVSGCGLQGLAMENEKIGSYKDLVVWQKAMDLVIEIYRLSEQFPKTELYGLSAQMRRAAVSIPSNIAEGQRRGTRNDYRNFLRIAYGSGAELETQLEIAKRLSFVNDAMYEAANRLMDEVLRMLYVMIRRLSE
jgi:four helix bundle protein